MFLITIKNNYSSIFHRFKLMMWLERESAFSYQITVKSVWCFRSAADTDSVMWQKKEGVCVSEFNSSLVYLPLQAWPHIPLTDGSRPLQPLPDRPVPTDLSKVSWSESASRATPSSWAAYCSGAGLFEKKKPATETHQNTVIKKRITSVLSLCVRKGQLCPSQGQLYL